MPPELLKYELRTLCYIISSRGRQPVLLSTTWRVRRHTRGHVFRDAHLTLHQWALFPWKRPDVFRSWGVHATHLTSHDPCGWRSWPAVGDDGPVRESGSAGRESVRPAGSGFNGSRAGPVGESRWSRCFALEPHGTSRQESGGVGQRSSNSLMELMNSHSHLISNRSATKNI